MRSSSGEHWLALDHLRLLAAFMVFTWHFSHGINGYPVPFQGAPSFIPLALFDEGHTGVALFMVLSGYLFAKLLAGKKIIYSDFFYNRILRLAPLFIVILVIDAAIKYKNGTPLFDSIIVFLKGFIYPIWPNGGWSIAVELHFYCLLPGLLWLMQRSIKWIYLILIYVITIRAVIFFSAGEIQSLSYWTILGRIDQFIAGMLAFHLRSLIVKNNVLLLSVAITFMITYWLFDKAGGFYEMPSYPSSNFIWIFLPIIEGISYSLFIAWYDNIMQPPFSNYSKTIGKMGAYAYSIYLFHPFFIFKFSTFMHENLYSLSNFNIALLSSFICFILIMPIGYLSYRYIESPFLKKRKLYIKNNV